MLRPVLYLVAFAAAAALLMPDLAGRLLLREPVVAAVPAERSAVETAGIARVAADARGHYVADIEVNGRRLPAIVDTGASLVALRYEDARALGIVLLGDKFDRSVSTANGIGRARLVRLRSLRIGGILLNDVDALVLDKGLLATNLLGMSFLRRLARYEVRGSTLILER
jgi:aspartyl protease family protein